MSGDDTMMFDNYHSFFGFWILGILILLVIALLVASDASKYGENGFLWGFVVFIMPMMGLLIYAIIRSGWTVRATNSTPVANNVTPPTVVTTSNRTINNPTPAIDNVIYCTSCGYANPREAAYCNKCGTKIPGGT